MADLRIKAIGFTGSRGAGTAFTEIAASCREPIPVYAEMSSINPVILFPNALATRRAEIGRPLVLALTLGAGQFCTNPGLVLVVDGEGYDDFVAEAAAATMLTPCIDKSYRAGAEKLASNPAVKSVGRGLGGDKHQGQAGIFETSADAFFSDTESQEELFDAPTASWRGAWFPCSNGKPGV